MGNDNERRNRGLPSWALTVQKKRYSVLVLNLRQSLITNRS
jgi:hypothetical protein